MKIKAMLWCCCILLLWSCADDDDSHGTNKDINWFEIKDNPNDELQHLAYLVYRESGIPIFYNDTIGSENRGVDANGEPIVYYEVLDLGYTLTSTNTKLQYGVPASRENVKTGIELLRDKVIPRLPQLVHVPSFLLVDTLSYDESGYIKVGLNCYKGFMTTAVGAMERIHEMTEIEKELLAGEVVGTLVAGCLDEKFALALEDFYAVSKNLKVDDPYGYGRYDFGMYDVFVSTSQLGEKEKFGFLVEAKYKKGYPEYGEYYTPTKKEDLESYLIAYYSWKESDFMEKYKDYKYVTEKYTWIKTFMNEMFK